MTMHFEELWIKGEDFHKETCENESVADIINELTMKASLYSAIDQKSEISLEDKQMAKSRLLGEILLMLTNLSFKDNINVFEALYVALSQHSISHYSEKYSD